MATITTLEVQKRDKERVNVYLDGEYAFSLTLVEAVLLHKGQELSPAEIDALREADSVNRAVDKAARFLAYRPRSEHEVRHNLVGKGFSETTIDAAIARLHALQYLNDTAFARYWLENRSTFKPRGPRALRYELRQKGVADSIIESVLVDVDVDQVAYKAASNQARRLRGHDRQTFGTKLSAFLQRRGFDYGTIRDTINYLTSQLDDEGFFDVE